MKIALPSLAISRGLAVASTWMLTQGLTNTKAISAELPIICPSGELANLGGPAHTR